MPQVDEKLVRQAEHGTQQSGMIQTLSQAEKADAQNAQSLLRGLEDRMVRQEEESRLLAKRLNQQG